MVSTTILILIICIATCNGYSVDNSENTENSMQKRDLNSRWGAAGMPYSMFHMNHQAKVQAHLIKQQQIKNERLLRNLVYEKTTSTPPSRRTAATRRRHAVPQLYFSYGWGPMG